MLLYKILKTKKAFLFLNYQHILRGNFKKTIEKNHFIMMTESPLSIPVYDGSLVSVRSTSSAVSRLHPSAGAAKR